MALPRPKILTAITVPTGGWTFKFYLSNIAQYDTACECTVSAGTYFMAGDQQADCFLRELTDVAQTEIAAEGFGDIWFAATIDSDHKAVLNFEGAGASGNPGNNVKVAWTECTAGLCEVLGADDSADDTSTGTDYPQFTCDWHHGYGWYADEDGQLGDLGPVDFNITNTMSATSLAGNVKAQLVGDRYVNSITLQHLERDYNGRTKVFSDGMSYGDDPVHPYNRNEPLECWWYEARQGTRFRVYRDGYIDTARSVDRGTSTARGDTSLTDAGKSWETEPYRWDGRILYVPGVVNQNDGEGQGINLWWYISSHTATVLTIPEHPTSEMHPTDGATHAYYLFDHTYQTYVVDLERMREFRPGEIPQIDRWGITIPLKRYV